MKNNSQNFVVFENSLPVSGKSGSLENIGKNTPAEKYTPTRHFYDRIGYSKEAQINDFYTEGDGKVFFVKRL
jgi:hypothetical protein